MRKLCEHGLADRYRNGRCRTCKLESKKRSRKLRGRTPAEREYMRKWHRRASGRASYIFRQVQKRSQDKGFPAPTITAAWIAARIERGVCEMSGLPFRQGLAMRSPFSASVDRIDSTKGYTPENCRVILWALNAAFAEWGDEVFAGIAETWLAYRKAGRDLI